MNKHSDNAQQTKLYSIKDREIKCNPLPFLSFRPSCLDQMNAIQFEKIAEAEMSRIVKAVNMHDELVEILGRVVRQAQTPNSFDPSKINQTTLLMARKLIGQAEQK